MNIYILMEQKQAQAENKTASRISHSGSRGKIYADADGRRK